MYSIVGSVVNSLIGVGRVRFPTQTSGIYPELCSLNFITMFITVPTRTSTAIESLKVDLLARKARVIFQGSLNEEEYEYENVSARAIANVLFNPDVSLGFWVNNNCLKANRVIDKGITETQFFAEPQLPSFV